jgi:16S rRNA (cytidine1402-2'-O)-methyltransferase
VSGTLFLVGTPIGNLGDLSDRARETLASVDVIAAEDTRRTGRLLAGLGVRAEMLSYFEGNERSRTGRLVEVLAGGKNVAVVTDAGMPSLSDPGYRLVRACVEAGIEVRVVPGPSAAVAALSVSGLPTDRFSFEGFLPRKAGERRARLAALADDPRTLVLFESPRRVVETLEDAITVWGDRRVALARELTKLHEEVLRGRATEVLAEVRRRGEMRGEVVLVIEGAAETPPSAEELVGEAASLVATGMRRREAAAEVARRHGASANELYRALVERPTS